MTDHVFDVAVIGAGLGGIAVAYRLQRAGVANFVVLEKAAELGGVWRDNTYPGAGCDVPSILYSYSFAPKSDWTRRYPGQAEIKTYIEGVVDRFGLRPRLRFGCEVAAAEFDPDSHRWRVTLGTGETLVARVLVSAVGQLNRPKIPPLPGLDSFAGTSFHSARWRHDHDLTGRTVAVIGNGASAIQFVPQIAPLVTTLHLFQRTPGRVMPKPDRPHTPREHFVYRHLPFYQRLLRLRLYLQTEQNVKRLRTGSKANLAFFDVADALIRSVVTDAALLAKVTPDYPAGCNRTTLSNDWYPTLSRANVDVVVEPIDRVEPDAVVTSDGVRRPVDTLIFATGFEATSFLAPMRIAGLDGQVLSEVWRDGAEAYKGMTVPGFPNFFMVYGPNTNAYNSIIMMIEAQAWYIARQVRRILRHPSGYHDVRADVARRYNERIQRTISGLVWTQDCRNWFKTATGKVTTNWPHSTLRYRWEVRRAERGAYRVVQPKAGPGR